MSSSSTLYIKANDNVKIFYTTHFGEDSGLDLFFPEDITINPEEVKKVDLGISCEMIEESLVDVKTLKKNSSYESCKINNFGEFIESNKFYFTKKNVCYYLYAKSSIANTPLILTNNVEIVDSSYRNNIKVYLRNISSKSYTIRRGDSLVKICARNLNNFTYELIGF